MRNVLLIARRELSAYLRTMSGYLIIAGMLFVLGLLFNVWAIPGVAKKSSEILGDFFRVAGGMTMFCAVLLSMRLLAEERQSGTIALLYSSPVRDGEIVFGKFLSALVFLCLFLAASLYMPVLLMVYGKVSWGHLASGYLGLFLLGSATLAIGTLGSALTRSQVLAAILSGCISIAFVIAWALAAISERPLSDIFGSLAFWAHATAFEKGLVQVQHVGFFVVFTYVMLFAATRVLEARRWK
jgi:ABC-2 type transport system permease protein